MQQKGSQWKEVVMCITAVYTLREAQHLEAQNEISLHCRKH